MSVGAPITIPDGQATVNLFPVSVKTDASRNRLFTVHRQDVPVSVIW
jgi:hypothetical protein